MRFRPLSFLLGMAVGIIIFGIWAWFHIPPAEELKIDEICNERSIEIIPKEVTIVEISTLPDFIQGLGQGEPIEIPKTVVYVEPAKGTLSSAAGRVTGPTNEETWYNLNMTRVVETMRRKGYDEENYPYYIRDDGVKMLGDYVMVAADLSIHPRGVVVETSLGQGLVCDTGEFEEDIYDIATDW